MIYHRQMATTTQKQKRQVEFARRLRKSAIRSRLSPLLDIIMPPICLHCHKPVSDHGQLCPPCWGQIDFIARPFCDVTGIPLPYDSLAYGKDQQIVSALALAQPPLYDRARAVAQFGDVMRHLVHKLKYGDRREGLSLFGRWMLMTGHEFLLESDLIVPVPLYRTRLWQRRFNQSALLGFELQHLTGIPVDVFSLKRRRATRSQVGLSQNARRTNVTGAFDLSPRRKKLIEGRNILLIDDVLTTGSTVDACAHTLKKSGASSVNVLVLARTGIGADLETDV